MTTLGDITPWQIISLIQQLADPSTENSQLVNDFSKIDHQCTQLFKKMFDPKSPQRIPPTTIFSTALETAESRNRAKKVLSAILSTYTS